MYVVKGENVRRNIFMKNTKILKYSFYYETLLLFRKKIYYIVYLPLLYFLYYSINDGITSLTFSAYVVQTLILGCMLIGFQNTVREEKEMDKQVLLLVPKRHLMLMARTMATQLYVTVINIVLLAEIYLFAFILKTPTWIRREALIYWGFYFVMPSMISVIIGQIIALFGERKVSYIVMLLIGISIGPLGKEFLELIATILNTSVLRAVAGMLSIGQYDAHEPFHYLYGYEIESKRIWHRVCFLLVTEIVWSVICWRKQYCINIKKGTFYFKKILIIIICLSLSIVQYNQMCFCRKTGIMEDTAQALYDMSYYDVAQTNDYEGEWELKKIDATVNAKKALEVIGTLEATLKKDTKKLTMSLYHDLKLLSVSLKQEKLAFTQSGDAIEIQLGRISKKGDTLSLNFHYKGLTSPYFFAGEKAVYLPGYYNWLPCPGKKNSFIEDAGTVSTNPVHSNTNTEYLIRFESNSSVYSNLNLADGIWTGSGKYGVTFISGNLKEIKQDEMEIYATADKSDLFATKTASQLATYIDEFERLLGLKTIPVSKVIFIPTKYEKIGKYSGNTMVAGDTLISGAYEVVDENEQYLMRESLIGILAMNSHFIRLDRELQTEFIEKYLDAYQNNNDQGLKECRAYLKRLNQFEIGSESYVY